MVVKFIVVGNQLIFGNRPFERDLHAKLAERCGIPRELVSGGGLADSAARRIFGTSYGFGPYEPELIERLLPDWQVDTPAPY